MPDYESPSYTDIRKEESPGAMFARDEEEKGGIDEDDLLTTMEKGLEKKPFKGQKGE